MDTVQVYYTNLESNPPVRDYYWKDCEFCMINEFMTDEERKNFPNDGSDYSFVIRILKIIPTARGRIIREQNPHLQHPYHKGSMKTIPLNTIRDICSLKPRWIRFMIDQHPIEYRIEFSSDDKVKFLLQCIVNEIQCFTWDPQLTDHRSRRYVLQNEIVWKKYRTIELPRRQQNDNDDDDNFCEILRLDKTTPPPTDTRLHRRPMNLEPELPLTAPNTPVTSPQSSRQCPVNEMIRKDPFEKTDENIDFNMAGDDYFWDEDDIDDLMFKADEFDDDEFFTRDDS
ncbi:hypothetical protein BLA29_007361, partial [Euroglyphus maynei]